MNDIILPYNEHYMNCYLNNLFSILCTYDINFKKLSYDNCYNYTIESTNKGKFLHFDYSYEFYQKIYQLLFNECKEFDIYNSPLGKKIIGRREVQTIKEYIKTGYVFLKADLYYINIMNNLYYHTSHKDHFLFIVGYSESDDVFYILDDGDKGYNKYSISVSAFEECIKNCNIDETYYSGFGLKRQFNEAYIYEEGYVINAKRIINQIENIINADNFTEPVTDDDIINTIILSQRCYNRVLANKYLFSLIAMNNQFNVSKLYQSIDTLQGIWYRIRGALLMNKMSKRPLRYSFILKEINTSFEIEKNMWNEFINIY